jgi:hypothetical protein
MNVNYIQQFIYCSKLILFVNYSSALNTKNHLFQLKKEEVTSLNLIQLYPINMTGRRCYFIFYSNLPISLSLFDFQGQSTRAYCNNQYCLLYLL